MNIVCYSKRQEALKEATEHLRQYITMVLKDSELICLGEDADREQMQTDLYPDVLFYDMEGKEPKAAESELLDILQQAQGCVPILLAETADHAMFGYRIHAFDYLMSPLTGEKLVDSLKELIRRKYSHVVQAIPIKVKGEWTKLEMEHICYMETSNHHTIFHMDDGEEFSKAGNFRELEARLHANPFMFQCHKSYVVNGRYIKSMQQTGFIMKGGRKVSISRPYRKAARLFYAWCVTGVYATEQECLPVDFSP